MQKKRKSWVASCCEAGQGWGGGWKCRVGHGTRGAPKDALLAPSNCGATTKRVLSRHDGPFIREVGLGSLSFFNYIKMNDNVLIALDRIRFYAHDAFVTVTQVGASV